MFAIASKLSKFEWISGISIRYIGQVPDIWLPAEDSDYWRTGQEQYTNQY
jgi:hypothetical protein